MMFMQQFVINIHNPPLIIISPSVIKVLIKPFKVSVCREGLKIHTGMHTNCYLAVRQQVLCSFCFLNSRYHDSPRNGTLTNSRRLKAVAEAKPFINGRYFKALCGPAQLFITKLRRRGISKLRNGFGSVNRTHFRWSCLRKYIGGRSVSSTPLRCNDVSLAP